MQTGVDALRVIEFGDSGIAAAYAGWLLARMGAQVVRLLPAGEPAGSASAEPPGPIALALESLADGKVVESMPLTRAACDARLAACDLLLSDTLAALVALAGPVDAITHRMPRLVVGVASVFGLDGPYASHPGVALDAQALSGAAWALGEPGREPLSLPPGILEHQAGAMLAAAALMALSVRDARGTGRVVDIALADVLASHVAGNCRFYIHHGMRWQRSGRRASDSGGAYPFVILPCRDGEVCITGRTREEWQRLVRVMGDPAWAAQPRYQDLRAMGRQYPEEVDALLRPWLAQHTMAELERLALANNLIVSPIRSFDAVLQTRHFSDDGFLESGRVAGRALRVPSLPFKASATRVPGATDLTGTLLGARSPGAAAGTGGQSTGSAGTAVTDAPLAGLRVLDMGWVWSAPWVGTMLAELGAQVIKVEHAMRPDNLRLSGRVYRDGVRVEGPSTEMSPMFHQVNHGKLGITLNAKAPRAVELLEQLVSISDVVIENMSPGSMNRQGLGWDRLRTINPGLVMLSMSSVGQFGELSSMRAYAPTMSSFAGMEALVGYPGEAPIGALNFALADPNASLHGLVALLAGLHRRRATGQGCYLDLSQVEALLGTLRPWLLDAQVRGRQPPPAGNAHPDHAPHGIYPALGDDAWFTIAVTDDAQWHALCTLAAGAPFAADARFHRRAGRLGARAELDRALAAWTAAGDRDERVAALRAAGIAASPVLDIDAAWSDPGFVHRGMVHTVTLPWYGEATLLQAPWHFSDFAPRVDRPAPLLGQHNDEVFSGLLGLPADEIARLKADGVIA